MMMAAATIFSFSHSAAVGTEADKGSVMPPPGPCAHLLRALPAALSPCVLKLPPHSRPNPAVPTLSAVSELKKSSMLESLLDWHTPEAPQLPSLQLDPAERIRFSLLGSSGAAKSPLTTLS